MHASLVVHPGCKEITEAYPTQKVGTDTIGNGVDYITAILSRVDVYTERPFAERHVDYLDNGVGDGSDIRDRRHTGGKAILDLISESLMRTRIVFSIPRFVVWEAGILEVIGSRTESARHDNGCLDPPASHSTRL